MEVLPWGGAYRAVNTPHWTSSPWRKAGGHLRWNLKSVAALRALKPAARRGPKTAFDRALSDPTRAPFGGVARGASRHHSKSTARPVPGTFHRGRGVGGR